MGELVQAARTRLRGAGLRRVVAAEPLRADPDPALQARLGAGDAGGDPLSDPACNPYLAFAALLHAGLEGIERGYELPGRDDDEPLPAVRGRAQGAAGSSLYPARSARRSRSFAASELMKTGPRRAHLPALRRAEAQGVGRVPHPGHAVGEGPVPGRSFGPKFRAAWPSMHGSVPGWTRVPPRDLDFRQRMAHDPRCRPRRKASGKPVSDGRSRVPLWGPVVVTADCRACRNRSE